MSERMIPLKIADMAVAACNEEIAKLQAENARLKAELDRVTSQNGYAYTGLAVGMLREELAQKCHDNLEIRKAHQATVQIVRDLQAEVERLEKQEEYLQNTLNQYALDDMRLQAEVERLESDLKLEKENEDRLVRLWQTANNEVHGQRSQIAALIDNQTSLKAEVERLRKAGDKMAKRTEFFQKRWDADELCQEVEAWNAAKEGKQS